MQWKTRIIRQNKVQRQVTSAIQHYSIGYIRRFTNCTAMTIVISIWCFYQYFFCLCCSWYNKLYDDDDDDDLGIVTHNMKNNSHLILFKHLSQVVIVTDNNGNRSDNILCWREKWLHVWVGSRQAGGKINDMGWVGKGKRKKMDGVGEGLGVGLYITLIWLRWKPISFTVPFLLSLYSPRLSQASLFHLTQISLSFTVISFMPLFMLFDL